MSKPFYTNVTRNANYIYFRGYANGKRIQKKVKYKPTQTTQHTKGNTVQIT